MIPIFTSQKYIHFVEIQAHLVVCYLIDICFSTSLILLSFVHHKGSGGMAE